MTTQEKVNLYLSEQAKYKHQITKFGPNGQFSYYKLGNEIIEMFPQDTTPKGGQRRVSSDRFLNINLEEITSTEARELRHAGKPTICIEYDCKQVMIG